MILNNGLKTRKFAVDADITIFVVDDDESVCRGLRKVLKAGGYRVVTFTSVEEFLKSAPFAGRSVLVLDVCMPGMSGLDLQKQLMDKGSQIPIIFMTAHEGTEARTRALENGAVAFLKKPFRDKVLFDAIRTGIECVHEDSIKFLSVKKDG